jgi:type IV secretion system protein VirB6
MNNWAFFATLYAGINGPVTAFVATAIAALSGYVTPILQAMIVVYIAGNALVLALRGGGDDALMALLRNAIRAALVLFIVSNVANFNQYFGTLFLTTIPTEVGNQLTNAAGAQAVTGAAFDTVANQAYHAGLSVFEALPWSLKSIVLGGLIGIYWILAVFAIGIAFAAFISAHIMVALAVAIGPLCVCFFLFPATRGFFNGWVAVLLSSVLTQILTLVVLGLLTASENQTIGQIVTGSGGVGNAATSQLLQLIYGMVLFGLVALLAVQVPGIAFGIAGGVNHSIASITQMFGSSAAAVGRGAAAIPEAAWNATAPAPSAGARPPPGRSLSSSKS